MIDVNHSFRLTATIFAAVVNSAMSMHEEAVAGDVLHFRPVFVEADLPLGAGLLASFFASAVR